MEAQKVNLAPELKIVRAEGFMTAEMDDDLVMMSIENSSYYGMDKVGRAIWEHLENPISIDQLCTNLVQKFDVDKEQCMSDILPFIENMQQEGIIKTI